MLCYDYSTIFFTGIGITVVAVPPLKTVAQKQKRKHKMYNRIHLKYKCGL